MIEIDGPVVVDICVDKEEESIITLLSPPNFLNFRNVDQPDEQGRYHGVTFHSDGR